MQDQVDNTTNYLERFFSNIVDALPAIIGALVLLLIAYIVAKLLETAVRAIMKRVNLNVRLHTASGGNFIQRAIPNPTVFLARVVFWLVFLFGLSIAISVLGIPFLNEFLRDVYGYIPNIIAAVLIFLVASGISAAAVKLVNNTMGETPTGKVVSTSVPIVVMSIAAFMILNQLRIAPEIVVITYAALIGSAALGMALAFGLGGREVASKILGDLYVKGQQNKERIKDDIKVGTTSAKHQARTKLR